MISYSEIVQARHKDLSPTNWSYALKDRGNQFGMDVIISEVPKYDLGKMALWIPVADGNIRDGVGDYLHIEGIDTARHRLNPLCLFDHGKEKKLPLGSFQERDTPKYTFEIDPLSKTAGGWAYFYQGRSREENVEVERKDEYEHAIFCHQTFDMAVKGLIRGGSIGYQVKVARELPPDYERGIPKGLDLLMVLMLEGSLVILPANMRTVNTDMVQKFLCDGVCCGKSLDPILIKSLEGMGAPPRNTTVSVPLQTLPKEPIPPATWKPGLGATKTLDDIPNYRNATGSDRCGSCKHFKKMSGSIGQCAKYIAPVGENMVCDSYEPASKSMVLHPEEDSYRSLNTADAPGNFGSNLKALYRVKELRDKYRGKSFAYKWDIAVQYGDGSTAFIQVYAPDMVRAKKEAYTHDPDIIRVLAVSKASVLPQHSKDITAVGYTLELDTVSPEHEESQEPLISAEEVKALRMCIREKDFGYWLRLGAQLLTDRRTWSIAMQVPELVDKLRALYHNGISPREALQEALTSKVARDAVMHYLEGSYADKALKRGSAPFQGPSGRWFVMKNGRAVPFKKSGSGTPGKPAGKVKPPVIKEETARSQNDLRKLDEAEKEVEGQTPKNNTPPQIEERFVNNGARAYVVSSKIGGVLPKVGPVHHDSVVLCPKGEEPIEGRNSNKNCLSLGLQPGVETFQVEPQRVSAVARPAKASPQEVARRIEGFRKPYSVIRNNCQHAAAEVTKSLREKYKSFKVDIQQRNDRFYVIVNGQEIGWVGSIRDAQDLKETIIDENKKVWENPQVRRDLDIHRNSLDITCDKCQSTHKPGPCKKAGGGTAQAAGPATRKQKQPDYLEMEGDEHNVYVRQGFMRGGLAGRNHYRPVPKNSRAGRRALAKMEALRQQHSEGKSLKGTVNAVRAVGRAARAAAPHAVNTVRHAGSFVAKHPVAVPVAAGAIGYATGEKQMLSVKALRAKYKGKKELEESFHKDVGSTVGHAIRKVGQHIAKHPHSSAAIAGAVGLHVGHKVGRRQGGSEGTQAVVDNPHFYGLKETHKDLEESGDEKNTAAFSQANHVTNAVNHAAQVLKRGFHAASQAAPAARKIVGQASGFARKVKSLRQKYRTSAKGLRRRVKNSQAGHTTMRCHEKDLKHVERMAKRNGLQFHHMGEGKVKLIGDNDSADKVARTFGRPMRRPN